MTWRKKELGTLGDKPEKSLDHIIRSLYLIRQQWSDWQELSFACVCVCVYVDVGKSFKINFSHWTFTMTMWCTIRFTILSQFGRGSRGLETEVGDWLEDYSNSPHIQFREAEFTLLCGLHCVSVCSTPHVSLSCKTPEVHFLSGFEFLEMSKLINK